MKLYLLFAILLLPVEIFAQTTLSGTVTEKGSDEVIIGASIALYADSVSGKAFRGGYSNKYGFYSIPKVPAGKYYLVARYIGYESVRREVTVRAEDKSLKINIILEKKDVRTEEVTVEANRENTTTQTISTVSVDPEFISKLPSLGAERDVFRALQLLPGIKGSSELFSGLYVRGGSPDQNLILLDGAIVYNPMHLGGFLSVFNADALRDVRVIKGALPAEYGGRLSSVVDMTMKEGTKEKFSGSGALTLISSRLTLEGPISENASFMVSGRRMYLDLIMPFLPESEDAPRYYFYDLNAKLNYKISESDRIYASGYFGRDVFNPPTGADADEVFAINWGNSTANLRWTHVVSPELFTNSSLIYTDYTFSMGIGDTSDPFSTLSRIRDYMLRSEAQYFPSDDHVWKAGIEATLHNFGVSISSSFIPAAELEGKQRKLSSLDAALYLQDEWRVNDALTTNLGGRLYYFQNGNYWNFEPRLSASYMLNENIKLNGSAALANQFLHLISNENFSLPTDVWFPSTSSLAPSRAAQAVLGIETTFLDREYLFSIEGYYKDMRNLYEYKENVGFEDQTLGVPLESQLTSGRGEAYGVEFFLNKKLGKLNGWIGYTLAWTKRYFDELNNGKPFYPRYDRRHDLSVVLTYELSESWELGATWTYASGQTYTMPTGQYFFEPAPGPNSNPYRTRYYADYSERGNYRLPPFHKLDLNFVYKYSWFGIPWEFSLNLYNAYNRRNPFAQYLDYDYNYSGSSQIDNGGARTVKQITLFPIIPSFGFRFKF